MNLFVQVLQLAVHSEFANSLQFTSVVMKRNLFLLQYAWNQC